MAKGPMSRHSPGVSSSSPHNEGDEAATKVVVAMATAFMMVGVVVSMLRATAVACWMD